MSEYPEELVERVARAIRETNPALTRGHLSEAEGVHSDAAAYAVAALDALGLREEWGAAYVDGYSGIVTCIDEEWARKLSAEDEIPTMRRYVTEWEAA